jgi:uncharacterized RDD family membrane protein YckC
MFCLSCGAGIEASHRFCASCGASQLETRAEPEPWFNSRPRLASIPARAAAAILDFFAIWSLIAMIGISLPQQLVRDGFERKGLAVLIPVGLCLIGLTYYILSETLFGATAGKGIVGIQVRLCNDEACNFQAAFLRNMFRIVDAFACYAVGIVVAAVSQSRQRIGDFVAGTVVVRWPAKLVWRSFAALLWIALAGGGLVACFVVPRR